MITTQLSGPAMITWQLTRDCNLACLHCCTDSAPGKALPNELTREQALDLVRQIGEMNVPKVMLAGGEPTLVPHFVQVARALGDAGVCIKIETNGQAFTAETAAQLQGLPIFSIQISLDGDTQETYSRMRPGGSLKKAHDACAAATAAGFALEITFAPTRLNIHEAEQVIDRAASLAAFRFNSGMLMRVGTAAKLWERLEPSREQYAKFLKLLKRKELEYRTRRAGDRPGAGSGARRMEVCFRPWSLEKELASMASNPPGTVLVLPDGRVKVCAALPWTCSDLRRRTLAQAWQDYGRAWQSPAVLDSIAEVAADPSLLRRSNDWRMLEAHDIPTRVAVFAS